MLGCKAIDTPIEPNHKLGKALQESMVDKGSYQRLVGKCWRVLAAKELSEKEETVADMQQEENNPVKIRIKCNEDKLLKIRINNRRR